MKQPSFLARKTLGQPNYFLIAMAVAFLVALMPRGARLAIESNNNNAADWLPSNYSESVDLRWFRDHFVGQQFALVSWDGCTLGNPEKLNFFVKKLLARKEAIDVADPHSKMAERPFWYESVLTGPSVLDQMSGPDAGIPYGIACKRLEGALVGPKKVDASGKKLGNESRTTCAVVFLSSEATRDNRTMRQAIEGITATLVNDCAIPEEQIRMGGPPVDNIQIDIEGERTLIRLAGLSGIVGLLLSYWCFRSIKLTSIVFTVGVISAGMSLAIVFYFGIAEVWLFGMPKARLGTVDAILMSMPAVVYVLGLSGAIHTVNYYRDARREAGLHGAAESAVKMGWGPCLLAALTTAVGLGSLYTSDILPIKKFGMFSGIAVLGTVGVLFTVLPVFLHRFPISDDLVRRQSGGKHGGHLPSWAQRVFGVVINHNVAVVAMWLAVMAGVGFGMTKIGTSVQLLKLLDEDADLIHDYAWLEENLGNLVPMEVVLTIPEERTAEPGEAPDADGMQYRLTMVDRIALTRMIQERIEALDEVSRSLSLATFAPKQSNSGLAVLDGSVDSTTNRRLTDLRDELRNGDYLRFEKSPTTDAAGNQVIDRELWRVSARVAALSDGDEGVDYGLFVNDLKKAVDPVLFALDQRDVIVRELAKREKSIRGSKFVMLYRSNEEDTKLTKDSQEAVLRELLLSSGADAGRGGVISFNLAKFDRPGRGSAEEDNAYRDAAINRLMEEYDALILVSAGSDPTARQMAAGGLPIIDVSNSPLLSQSASISAAKPLLKTDLPRPIRAVFTGMVPVVYKTQRQLLKSLRESIGWATLLIAGVMMVVLRSPMAGLISMIPNVFPIVMVFGALGWLGIKVDIGIMMTASVALGVAVDDTVHFLTWFRRGVAQGLDRKQSAVLAYERCATAMLQTTLIGGLGLAVFATSSFTPTQQFGYLMITMLGTALVGDLLLLPAILTSPLGRFFGGKASPEAHIDWSSMEASVHDDGGLDGDQDRDQGDWPQSDSADEPDSRTIATEQPVGSPTAAERVESPATGNTASSSIEEDRHSIKHGPHAELHAKLRRLRRESSDR
ncbi:efflux RND transporter permease subunit [Adhaeretor mobilis]|uniref:MMPL family protein n=1 Tax=Adhaeretor mobilis TaxID=1930276 RepID=A0A517MRR7_9BACT|nr:MMPL family transporter [Adhaeretor mobilis]QDS97582.1 MMPL family protein [Adhaeretor mobilis]